MAMRQASEPSVEEILESIKKVIARDNREEAAEERRTRESVGMSEPDVDDAEAIGEGEHVLELDSATQLDEDTGQVFPAPDASDDDGPLVREAARTSMQESFAALAMLAEPGARPQIVRSGETSLEGLTRELLRPALAEWLEANLPAIVERMVAAEIARIAGKRP
jgi:cell pole-organizing protein PopZ